MNQLSQVIQELIKTALTLLHWGHTFMTSTKNDQFCDPTHSQKLFSDDRFRKYVTNFNTPPFTFHVNAINVWSLAPQTFKTNHLTYLSVALRFQKTNIQCLEISADSADSFCITNQRNRRKIEKTSHYEQEAGLLFHRVETEKSVKSVKLNKYFFHSRGQVIQELILVTIYLFTVDKKNVLHSFRQKKANYSHFDQDFLYLLGLHLKHSKPLVYFKN